MTDLLSFGTLAASLSTDGRATVPAQVSNISEYETYMSGRVAIPVTDVTLARWQLDMHNMLFAATRPGYRGPITPEHARVMRLRILATCVERGGTDLTRYTPTQSDFTHDKAFMILRSLCHEIEGGDQMFDVAAAPPPGRHASVAADMWAATGRKFPFAIRNKIVPDVQVPIMEYDFQTLIRTLRALTVRWDHICITLDTRTEFLSYVTMLERRVALTILHEIKKSPYMLRSVWHLATASMDHLKCAGEFIVWCAAIFRTAHATANELSRFKTSVPVPRTFMPGVFWEHFVATIESEVALLPPTILTDPIGQIFLSRVIRPGDRALYKFLNEGRSCTPVDILISQRHDQTYLELDRFCSLPLAQLWHITASGGSYYAPIGPRMEWCMPAVMDIIYSKRLNTPLNWSKYYYGQLCIGPHIERIGNGYDVVDPEKDTRYACASFLYATYYLEYILYTQYNHGGAVYGYGGKVDLMPRLRETFYPFADG